MVIIALKEKSEFDIWTIHSCKLLEWNSCFNEEWQMAFFEMSKSGKYMSLNYVWCVCQIMSRCLLIFTLPYTYLVPY